MPLSDYPLPHPAKLSGGSGLARALLRMFGWHIDFDGFPARQGVIAVYPHTSNWDFPLGLLVKWALNLPVKFWGKDSLFKPAIVGRWMRWVGGIPINRRAAHGVVGETVATFNQARANDEFFWLVVAPEGTRRRTPGWRTGFYHVAQRADVPLCLVKFDYATKRVQIEDFIRLTGDVEHDFARMREVYAGVKGQRNDEAADIVPYEPRKQDKTA